MTSNDENMTINNNWFTNMYMLKQQFYILKERTKRPINTKKPSLEKQLGINIVQH